MEVLSPEAHALISDRQRRQDGRAGAVPSADNFRDPANCASAASELALLLSYGEHKRAGRRRAGGKRSRPTIEPKLISPDAQRGRPAQWAARALVGGVAAAYIAACGKEASYTASHHHRGPFVRLVSHVLRLVGAPHVDPVELVNWYGQEMKEGVVRIDRAREI